MNYGGPSNTNDNYELGDSYDSCPDSLDDDINSDENAQDSDYEDPSTLIYDENTYTIAVLGSSGTGKSSLVYQYVYETDYFTPDHHPSIYNKYKVERCFNGTVQQIRLIEVSAEPEYENLRHETIAESQAFVLVYSVTDRESFERIQALVEEIRAAQKKNIFPCILVANKSDQKTRAVTENEGRALATSLKCQLFPTSAKRHSSVDMTFHMILQRLYTFNHVEFSGYLEKKGGGKSAFGRKSWKKRWFCLEGTEIVYKKKFNSKKALGSIDLGQVVAIHKGKDEDKKFEIVLPDRTYRITAGSLSNKREWVEKVGTLIMAQTY